MNCNNPLLSRLRVCKNPFGGLSPNAIPYAPILLLVPGGIEQLVVLVNKGNIPLADFLPLDNQFITQGASSASLSLIGARFLGGGELVNYDPAVDSLVIERRTSPVPLVSFRDGAKLSALDLSKAIRQSLMLAEEAYAYSMDDLSVAVSESYEVLFDHAVMSKDLTAPVSADEDINPISPLEGRSGVWFDPTEGSLNVWAGNAWIRIATGGNPDGGASSLNQLLDVTITNPTNNQTLLYDANSSQWVNSSTSGPPSAISLNDLSDVSINNLSENHILTYQGGEWLNLAPALIALDGLTDVLITNPINTHILSYNGTSWVNIPNPAIPGNLALNDLTDVNTDNAVTGDVLRKTSGGSWGVTLATNLNNASTLVVRDTSGNFQANTITANLAGTATNISGVVPIVNGGTGATTKETAIINLLPTGNADTQGWVLTSQGAGTSVNWTAAGGVPGGGIESITITSSTGISPVNADTDGTFVLNLGNITPLGLVVGSASNVDNTKFFINSLEIKDTNSINLFRINTTNIEASIPIALKDTTIRGNLSVTHSSNTSLFSVNGTSGDVTTKSLQVAGDIIASGDIEAPMFIGDLDGTANKAIQLLTAPLTNNNVLTVDGGIWKSKAHVLVPAAVTNGYVLTASNGSWVEAEPGGSEGFTLAPQSVRDIHHYRGISGLHVSFIIVIAGGVITSITTNGAPCGFNPLDNPLTLSIVDVNPGGGQGGAAHANINSLGCIASVTVTAGGTGYTNQTVATLTSEGTKSGIINGLNLLGPMGAEKILPDQIIIPLNYSDAPDGVGNKHNPLTLVNKQYVDPLTGIGACIQLQLKWVQSQVAGAEYTFCLSGQFGMTGVTVVTTQAEFEADNFGLTFPLVCWQIPATGPQENSIWRIRSRFPDQEWVGLIASLGLGPTAALNFGTAETNLVGSIQELRRIKTQYNHQLAVAYPLRYPHANDDISIANNENIFYLNIHRVK